MSEQNKCYWFILNTGNIGFFPNYKCDKISWSEDTSVFVTQGQLITLADHKWFTHSLQLFLPSFYLKFPMNSKWKHFEQARNTLDTSWRTYKVWTLVFMFWLKVLHGADKPNSSQGESLGVWLFSHAKRKGLHPLKQN